MESVLAEVGEIYEGRDTRRERDQFLLNLFSLSPVLLLLIRELFLQLRGQIIPSLPLRIFHRLGLIDGGSTIDAPTARKPSMSITAAIAASDPKILLSVSLSTSTAHSYLRASRVAEVPAMVMSRMPQPTSGALLDGRRQSA